MVQKQLPRSERTKQDIVNAARKLFSKRGFEVVTMREIAQEAGCSHTTIYIYFENKLALLHYLSMRPLQGLKQQMEEIKALNLPGINFMEDSLRYYANGMFASHIIGFTRPDEETDELSGAVPFSSHSIRIRR